MKRLIFNAVFGPLIARNYRLRAAGRLPDKMYWADLLAMRLGMLRYYPDYWP
jgi:hypothetical protein